MPRDILRKTAAPSLLRRTRQQVPDSFANISGSARQVGAIPQDSGRRAGVAQGIYSDDEPLMENSSHPAPRHEPRDDLAFDSRTCVQDRKKTRFRYRALSLLIEVPGAFDQNSSIIMTSCPGDFQIFNTFA